MAEITFNHIVLGKTSKDNFKIINDNFAEAQATIGELQDGKLGKQEKAESAKVADNALAVNGHTVKTDVPENVVFFNQSEKEQALNGKETTVTVNGDVTDTTFKVGKEAEATLALTLKNIVSGGTGCKITVNNKGLVTSVEALAESDIPKLPHTKITGLGDVATLNKGTSAGNVVVVNESGKIDDTLIPKIAITDVFEAESEEAMLALSQAQFGDIAIRSDLSATFILAGDGNYATKGNWKQLATPTNTVLSVNGKTGVVTLTTKDIAEDTNLYYTEERANQNFNTNIAKTASTSLSDGAKIYRKGETSIVATDIIQDASHKFVSDAEKTSYADKYTKNEIDQKVRDLNNAISGTTSVEKIEFNATDNWGDSEDDIVTLTLAGNTNKYPIGVVYRKNKEKYEAVVADVAKEADNILVYSGEKFEGYMLVTTIKTE